MLSPQLGSHNKTVIPTMAEEIWHANQNLLHLRQTTENITLPLCVYGGKNKGSKLISVS